MKALVYGHSQSGGMGLDFVKLLKQQGYDVTRVTQSGWSDKQLQGGIPDLTGDPAQYDRIIYFGGANPQQSREATAQTLLENAALLGGPAKVTVILAPYNQDKEDPNVLSDRTTRGILYEETLRKAGYSTYRPLFPGYLFWPDRTHVKPYTKEGLEFAADALAGRDSRFANPTGPSLLLLVGGAVAAAVVLALVLRRRK